MLTLLTPLLLLWLSISLELAMTASLPHGCLFFPLVVGILLWRLTAARLLLVGAMLLVDWIARPTVWPLAALVLPLLMVCSNGAAGRVARYRDNSRRMIPEPVQAPLLTLLLVLLHQLGRQSVGDWLQLQAVLLSVLESMSLLSIAIPLSAVVSLLLKLSEELGIRRPLQRGV